MPLRERRRAQAQPLRPRGQLLQARMREVGEVLSRVPGTENMPAEAQAAACELAKARRNLGLSPAAFEPMHGRGRKCQQKMLQ